MKKSEITPSILEMHEEKFMQTLVEEVADELRDGIPENLQRELVGLLARANSEREHPKDNVLSFQPKVVINPQLPDVLNQLNY